MPQAPYIAIARGWLKHPVLRPKIFSRAEAWAWLIEEAAWQPSQAMIGGDVVDLARGQLSHSMRFMGKAWGWQHNKVQRFVALLCRCQMIDTDTDTGQLRITLCNYSKYQPSRRENATASETPPQQQRNSSATDLKKEITNPPTSSLRSEVRPQGGKTAKQEFEEFWSECPRKVGKTGALRKYIQARKATDAETLLTAMRRYATAVAGKDREFVAHPATWLHNGRWQDEDALPLTNGHDGGPLAPPVIKPEYLEWMRQMDEQENPH
jgi:hypothetical protein